MPYANQTQQFSGYRAGQVNNVDASMDRYGLSQFINGGQYSPDNLLGTFRSQLGPMQAAQFDFSQMPNVSAPSISQAQRYGYGAMDLGGRAAALQTGIAANSLEGLSPAARVAALSGIAQSGAANLGNLGAQGYSQALGLLQQGNMANADQRMQALMANMQAQQGTNQTNYESMANLFGQGLGISSQAGLSGAQMLQNAFQTAEAQRQAQKASNQGLFGTLGGIAGTLLGGPLGGAVGKLAGSGLRKLFGGGSSYSPHYGSYYGD